MDVTVISAFSALFGSVVGSFAVPLIKDHYSRKNDARYLAIKVVCILDPYVDECASVAASEQDHDEDGYVPQPEVPTYPDDLNWKSIDPNLMYRLLSLPVAAAHIKSYMQSVGEHNEDNYFNERTRQYILLCKQAYELSNSLKTQYQVTLNVKSPSDWDPMETIANEERRKRERDEQRAIAHQKFMKDAAESRAARGIVDDPKSCI